MGTTSLVRVSGGFLLFIVQMLLARWLGTEQFGAYSVAIAAGFTLATLGTYGWSGTSIRYLARYGATGAFDKSLGCLRYVTRATWWTSLAAASVALVLLGIARPLIDPGYRLPVALAVAGAPLVSMFLVQCAQARGFRRMNLSYVSDQVARPTLLIGLGSVLGFWFGIDEAWVYVLASLFSFLTVHLVQRRLLWRGVDARIKGSSACYESAEWHACARPVFFLSGSRMLHDTIPLLLVGLLMTPGEAGLFTAALRVATLAGFFSVIVASVIQPDIAALHVDRQSARLQTLVSHAALAGTLVAGSIFVFLVLAGKSILALFGESYVAAYPIMLVLSVGHLGAALYGPAVSLLLMTGHQAAAARLSFLGVIGLALSVSLLLPVLGTAGAAIASTVNLVVLGFLQHRAGESLTGISSRAFAR